MHLGVCYYPEHWPETMWEEDARRMKTLGIERVRIAEFAWSRIEPTPGQYDWAWLDRAVDTLHRAGLQIVMCTPTATPPKWLVDRHPDILPVGADGRARHFGSRRHYDFSSPSYYEAARAICTAVAAHYGNHPGVAFWQTDNEYGCHQTVVSYSNAAVARFREWLRARYGNVEALNRAWGTVFWSMEYRSFDEIDAPVATVTEAHPSHRLDYRRFASDEVARFNRMQVEIIRAHSPGRPIAHNFMQLFTEFDHYAVASDLDIAAWDSYPLGALEEQWFDAEVKGRWLRTGHPDFASFNHDVYRGMSKQPFWVMEQQPGPVNWAHWNPSPLPGMVRLWSWEAFAHGAGCVSYFRWRQAPFAQEQMHAGLNTPDNRLDMGGGEAARVADEIRALDQAHAEARASVRARVALVYDYPAKWLFEIHPQGADFHYPRFAFEYYSALRALGLDVDVVPADAPLDGYRMIVVPPLPIVPDDFAARLARSGAQVVVGPRTGSKTADLQIPANLPPGPLAQCMPMRVWRVESVRPSVRMPVHSSETSQAGATPAGYGRHWRDLVELRDEAAHEVVARFDDGHPAYVRFGAMHYLTSLFDEALTREWFAAIAARAQLETMRLPDGVRVSRRGGLTYVFNYEDEAYRIDAAEAGADAFVIGGPSVEPRGVAAYRNT
ncbi:beta-galactosidase [Trinickia caryophylli]|uniref:Beta-galactosidase n=1 Tax=Trinickia caryophylli TaxID=28094 RepID=A0A1X7CPK3_TRICW|nr:beta-galactosidase [Trinickia caryophylli]PMS11287.1 beta-galactosidase [Trinickia caryophylli]TRX20140.1 beta-galactosidase [Trinickia caryophylli]WQE12509.1 beta-galactosidase [Trinickia caryophylli]SMF00224.1 beta-galactosidase [Trinickia caryophylli]GLU30193.1 beta-galactosidase [Trinickia caryophylli]